MYCEMMTLSYLSVSDVMKLWILQDQTTRVHCMVGRSKAGGYWFTICMESKHVW